MRISPTRNKILPIPNGGNMNVVSAEALSNTYASAGILLPTRLNNISAIG